MIELCVIANDIIGFRWMVIALIGMGILTWKTFNYYFAGATTIFGIATFLRLVICV